MAHTAVESTSPASLSLFARFVGIITGPRATYERVVSRPTWLGMYVLTAAITAFGAALPMMTDTGRQAAVDQQVSTLEGFGMPVTDEEYQQLQNRAAILPYTAAASVVVGGLVMALLMGGMLFAVFNAALGGGATYKQILSVVVHASVINAAGQLFTGPINYFRGAVGSATSLSALLPMLDDQSFAGKLAGTIDVFIIWWLVVLAIGLGVLYRRKTQPIAVTLFVIYGAIAITIALLTS